MKNKIGIIGSGFVGSAVEIGFQQAANTITYDKFECSCSLNRVVDESDIIFICVPTPMSADGSCDVSIVESVVDEINQLTDERKMIVIKSTVIPGTTRRLAEKYLSHDFVFCPEYLTENNAFNDFFNQDRIILGLSGVSDRANNIDLLDLMIEFTKTQKNPAEIIETTSDAAEMAKYVANSFLAMKVSFCNEIYDICEKTDIDYNSVIGIVTRDKRITDSHTKVPGEDGRGWSKSCFPKDLNGLIALAKENDLDPLILETVWTRNLLDRSDRDWEDLPQVTGEYCTSAKKWR